MARINVFTGLAEFLAVANHASFRAAGAELGVTPSAISQAVRALEARVGLPLFQRSHPVSDPTT
jgi:DNA-binding transcriptional LysR family regulator